MEIVPDLVKRVFALAFSAAKRLVGLLCGKNERIAKKLPLIAALLFLAVCVFQSLRALAAAEREAALRRSAN